jgi:hypothetical protein
LLDGQGDEALCRQARTIAEARAQSLGLRGTRHYFVIAPSIIAWSINFSGSS